MKTFVKFLGVASFCCGVLWSCQQQASNKQSSSTDTLKKEFSLGTFGYDLQFLNKYDSLIVLKSGDGIGQIIVSPKYQGKVFTSTASGEEGRSFGWVNYKAFDAPIDAHMNAYGGEDRLWLGPEGGPFSLYFAPGKEMVFENWKTPAAIDTEAWELIAVNETKVSLQKNTQLVNYAGTTLDISLDRSVEILTKNNIQSNLGIQFSEAVQAVGFSTINGIRNAGQLAWDKISGAPCLWNLNMFNPSDSTIIIVPYNEQGEGKIMTSDYFGEIPQDRIANKNGVIYFKADGKSRGKIGITSLRAKNLAGSYDLNAGVLTVTKFTVDSHKIYLNQEWTTKKYPFVGDAVNAYNDGPLADGGQMGPFYEIESVSPAAFLQPNERLEHLHQVYHFEGDKAEVAQIMKKLFTIQVADIQAAF